MDENKPVAKDMNLTDEFVYAAKIVSILKKIDLSKQCDQDESIRLIEKAFIEFKNKLIK